MRQLSGKPKMNASTQSSLRHSPLTDDSRLRESRWLSFAHTVSTWPKPAILGLLLGLVIAVGWVDYVTGFELSVSLLYLIPITIGTWIGSRSIGNLLAFASVGVWLFADFLAGHTYGHWFVPLWNALMLTGIFLVVVALLASLREVNEGLEQTVARRTKALQAENAQRRQAEEELRCALSDVRTAHSELQRTQFQLIEAAKMESVGRLAAGVAHEVKNPLMTLSLGADYFLNRKTENQDEVQLVQDMKEAVHRASNVINVLLDYARPRPLQRTSENLHNIIENSLALVRHQLNKQHVTVVREFDPALSPLSLDRTRIEQVFVNLFLNAMQAMPPGGTLTVRTFASSPFGGDSDAPANAMVEVDDTGHGIMQENLGKLFEPFFTTKPPGQGTGLGLAIVRKIMEVHGGSIRLGNRKEGRARATLQFNNNTEPKKELWTLNESLWWTTNRASPET
jgi:signal transduction histidine kinase